MTFSDDQMTINGYWPSAGCPLKSSLGPSLHRVFYSSQSILSSLFSITAEWDDFNLFVGRFLSILVMNLLCTSREIKKWVPSPQYSILACHTTQKMHVTMHQCKLVRSVVSRRQKFHDEFRAFDLSNAFWSGWPFLICWSFFLYYLLLPHSHHRTD